jgi:tetratricopeptide (TPR) repeat protein
MPRPRQTGRRWAPLLLLPILALAILARCGGDGSDRTQGEILYVQGKYAEALPHLSKQAETARTGIVLYQLGYCLYAASGDEGQRRALWEEAIPLLESELEGPEGATLERLYYLAAIGMTHGDLGEMKRFARRAIDEIEHGPDMTRLGGEDWFRLARMHDWLNEASEAEAAYRRAVSVFRKEAPGGNISYRTLSLARVGDLDFVQLHYGSASEAYDEAVSLSPDGAEIEPFNHGLSLLAIGRFADAAARLVEDRNQETASESRAAAAIARMAEETKPLIEEDFDGMKLGTMPMSHLQARLIESGGTLQQVRHRLSWKPGDPLAPELVDRQRRFLSLARERLIRTQRIREFLHREGLADLVAH